MIVLTDDDVTRRQACLHLQHPRLKLLMKVMSVSVSHCVFKMMMMMMMMCESNVCVILLTENPSNLLEDHAVVTT